MDNHGATTSLNAVVLIKAGQSLDLSAFRKFKDATNIARNHSLNTTIVVDLNITRQLFDSGKAALLALHQSTGHFKNRIRLTNVEPQIEQQLNLGKLSGLFDIHIKPAVSKMYQNQAVMS